MLWSYSLQFGGFIDAPNSLSEARQILIAKIKADPAAFVSKMVPAEPTQKTLVDLGKAVFGIKTS